MFCTSLLKLVHLLVRGEPPCNSLLLADKVAAVALKTREAHKKFAS